MDRICEGFANIFDGVMNKTIKPKKAVRLIKSLNKAINEEKLNG